MPTPGAARRQPLPGSTTSGTELVPFLKECYIRGMADEIDFKFLARQNERILNEMATFREDMTVLTAIVMRLEASVASLTVEVRALSSKVGRLENRLVKLEEADSAR